MMDSNDVFDHGTDDKAVEIRIQKIIYRADDTPAVVLAIKRTCALSGETQIGHVTIGEEHTLRLYLER